ncbi:hypothetical protein BG003_004780 [Podila horticola]|nr:hypothetical protein BG003_004780 [Podila horticola]
MAQLPRDSSKPSVFEIHLITQSICRNLTSGSIYACLQVSRAWYITFEPQLWHRVHLKSIWQPSWPFKRAILHNAHRIQHLDIEESFFLFLGSSQDRQEGITSPCTNLKSLRIMDTNIDTHPRHQYHTKWDRPSEDLNSSDSTTPILTTGSIEALTVSADDPPVSYEPNQIQAVLDIIDANPYIRSVELQLNCNSTLFCMALLKSLSRLRSLDTFKWVFACFFDQRLLWAFMWLLPDIQNLELLGHCTLQHHPEGADGSLEFFEHVAQLIRADKLLPAQENESSFTTITTSEHPLKTFSIESSLSFDSALPVTHYLTRSPRLTTLKLPTVSCQLAQDLVPILLSHCPDLRWIELCSSTAELPLDTALRLAQGYRLAGFAVGLEPTSVAPVVQALREHSAQTLEHFAIWRGSATYAADALALLTGFPRLEYLYMLSGEGTSALLSELVGVEWGCSAALRELRLGVYVDSHGIAQTLKRTRRGGLARTARAWPDSELRDRVAQQTLQLFRKLKQMPQLVRLKLEWVSTVEMGRNTGLAAMGEEEGKKMTYADLGWMGARWVWDDEALDPEIAALFD